MKFIFLMTLMLTFQVLAKPIVIGSKNFTEQLILGEMMAHMLEKKYGLEIERKLNLGGSTMTFNALDTGGIDLYVDYTGTGYISILKMDGTRDPEKIYNIVNREFQKKYGIEWSKSIGFNNTYGVSVRSDDNRFKGITKLSQLRGKVNEYSISTAHEFFERNDGYKGMKIAYGLNFKSDNLIGMDPGLMYNAIKDGEVDMIVAYTTDGRIPAFDLKILEDDANYFPPYHAAILAKSKRIEEVPEIKSLMKDFEGLINSKEMALMNYQVDLKKRDPKDVAYNFLVNKGLLNGELVEYKKTNSFWAYAYSKKGYLYKIFKEHMVLSFSALFLAIVVGVPIGITLSRYEKIATPVFGVINTFQTIPSLALLGFLIPLLGIGMTPAIVALFLYSLLPIVRNVYTGINGVDPDYVEASRGIGLTDKQILFKVEIPLALPIIIAGVRTAAVIVIGTATLADLIGAGGFGNPIFTGVQSVNSNLILLGAIPAALFAISVDKLLELSERLTVSKGLQ